VGIFLVIIVVMAVLSLYGCLSGGWDEQQEPTGYGWSSIMQMPVAHDQSDDVLGVRIVATARS
jgi:hypothetical protein